MAVALALTACSGGGIADKLASSLEECTSALASAELGLGQVSDGRSTKAAGLVLAEDMRDEISKARDSVAKLSADPGEEQSERSDALAHMDQALAAAMAAQDAVASGEQRSINDARQRLGQSSREIKQQIAALKAGGGA
jgi:small-conductance mechanosensitive channel